MTPHKQRLYRDKKKYQKRLDEALERKWVEMEARKAAKQKGMRPVVIIFICFDTDLFYRQTDHRLLNNCSSFRPPHDPVRPAGASC